MIVEPWLRWLVTVVFALSAAECVLAVSRARWSWPGAVSQGLHFVMAVAMAVMAWPAGAALPTTGPIWFFLFATGWFLAIALVRTAHRGVNVYHAAMMLAMVWMYAVMSGALLPAPSGPGPVVSAGSSMPGMVMPGATATSGTVTDPPLITGLNWLCAAGFTVAAGWWLYRCAVRRAPEPSAPAHPLVGGVAQLLMAAGSAVMFATLL